MIFKSIKEVWCNLIYSSTRMFRKNLKSFETNPAKVVLTNSFLKNFQNIFSLFDEKSVADSPVIISRKIRRLR